MGFLHSFGPAPREVLAIDGNFSRTTRHASPQMPSLGLRLAKGSATYVISQGNPYLKGSVRHKWLVSLLEVHSGDL